MNGLSDHHYNAYNTKDSAYYTERNDSKSSADCPANTHSKCTAGMKGDENKGGKRSAFAVVRQSPPRVSNAQLSQHNWQLAVQC